MAEAPSTATNPDFKTLPKQGVNSVVIRRRSKAEEQEARLKTREALKVYITKVFGDGLTDSEKAFIAAANETGKFSVRLVIYCIFLQWCMTAVALGGTILNESAFVVRCRIPAVENCLTFFEVLNISVTNKTPTLQTAVATQYCSYDDRDYTQLLATYSCKYQSILNAIKLKRETPKTKPCDGFVTASEGLPIFFKNNMPPSVTLRDDMKLFCGNDVWNRVFVFSYAYGQLASVLLLAPAADIFGRKKVFVIGSLIYFLSGMIVFSHWNIFMTLGFFLSGFGRCATYSLYVLFLELCSDVMVLRMGLLILLLVPSLSLVEFLLHYNIRYWIYLHLALTSMLLVFPFGIWYITESPRWLMFTGNTVAAWKVLKEIDTTVVLPDSDVHESVPIHRPSFRKITDFFCQPLFRDRITACIVLYFLTSISFYVWKNEVMQDSVLSTKESYFIRCGFEVIMTLAAYFSAIKLGRRKTSASFYCGLSILDALIFMENQYITNNEILPLMLSLRQSFKGSISCLLVFYTCEMFPTAYRVTAVNLCMASTFIGQVLQKHLFDIFHPEPKATLAFMPPFIASITCALMICFLPKTRNEGLPDIPRDALLFKFDS